MNLHGELMNCLPTDKSMKKRRRRRRMILVWEGMVKCTGDCCYRFWEDKGCVKFIGTEPCKHFMVQTVLKSFVECYDENATPISKNTTKSTALSFLFFFFFSCDLKSQVPRTCLTPSQKPNWLGSKQLNSHLHGWSSINQFNLNFCVIAYVSLVSTILSNL